MSAAAPAAMVEGWEATRQKKRRRKHREEVEVAAASSESPRLPATPDSKTESPPLVTAETLTLMGVAAGKGRKRKKQDVAAASSLVKEAVRKEEKKKGKRSEHEAAAAAATLSPSIPVAAATVQILEVAAEGAAARKEQRRGKLEQGQSGQQPSPVDVHPQGGEAVVDGGVSGSKCVRRSSNSKPRVLTDKEILRMRIAYLKEQSKLQGFVPAIPTPNSIGQDSKYSSPFGAFFEQFCYKPERWQGRNTPSLPKTPDPPARLPPRYHPSFPSSQSKLQGFAPAIPTPNSIGQDSKYSSPFGAFFEQFCYKPERRQGRNTPSLPKTPDPPARLPPRYHPSFPSSQLTANQKAAKATTLNIKRPPSASGSQVAAKAKETKRHDEKMGTTEKPKKKAPVLSAAEKGLDKYRRLPLNQLVTPPYSPYNLLQERYAHDPWKVIIICMLLNVTQGKQVRKKLEGFFERYPDAQTACTADPEKMAEYLAPLGCQRVKAKAIQKMSKDYVEEEWTYVTELFGVGKYAADAYAIFCAGRATEVVPEDHKLVDYWKYVCFELPTQASRNAEEAAGVTGQRNFAPVVQQIAVSC